MYFRINIRPSLSGIVLTIRAYDRQNGECLYKHPLAKTVKGLKQDEAHTAFFGAVREAEKALKALKHDLDTKFWVGSARCMDACVGSPFRTMRQKKDERLKEAFWTCLEEARFTDEEFKTINCFIENAMEREDETALYEEWAP